MQSFQFRIQKFEIEMALICLVIIWRFHKTDGINKAKR